jgi:hypothetical protein
MESIATLQQFSPEATAMFTDLTEARPLIQTEVNVKIRHGIQKNSGLVDCATTLDFVSEEFASLFQLVSMKSRHQFVLILANV